MRFRKMLASLAVVAALASPLAAIAATASPAAAESCGSTAPLPWTPYLSGSTVFSVTSGCYNGGDPWWILDTCVQKYTNSAWTDWGCSNWNGGHTVAITSCDSGYYYRTRSFWYYAWQGFTFGNYYSAYTTLC